MNKKPRQVSNLGPHSDRKTARYFAKARNTEKRESSIKSDRENGCIDTARFTIKGRGLEQVSGVLVFRAILNSRTFSPVNEGRTE